MIPAKRIICKGLFIDDVDDLPGGLFGVFLHYQLREDGFERRQAHQIAQMIHAVVGHHLPAVKNDDA